jgi:hypothetical protein
MSMSEETQEIPTTSRSAWIFAARIWGYYPAKTERSGKWLIFLSETVIDRYWQRIKEAVELGLLGEKAKTSTVRQGGMPPEVRRKKIARGDKRYVICVYTYDYEDKDDVMRIRQALRDVGIMYPITYKADEDTSKGNYGNDYTPKYRA